ASRLLTSYSMRLARIDLERPDHAVRHFAVVRCVPVGNNEQQIEEMFVGELARHDGDPLIDAGDRIDSAKRSRKRGSTRETQLLRAVAGELQVRTAALNLGHQILSRRLQRN